MSSFGTAPVTDAGLRSVLLSFNLAQAAATYNIATASGNVLVKSVTPFMSVAGVGLVTAALATDNTTVDVIMAATAVASLTAGKNLTPFATSFYLPTGKHLTGTIVGTGSAGTMLLLVEYYALSAGATLS